MWVSSVQLILSIVLCATLLQAEPEKAITDFGLSPELLISRPLEELREASSLSLDNLIAQDQKAALSRIHELPKLKTLKFYGCDLSGVDVDDPISQTVTTVYISGGNISQGTIRWLSKYPSGVTAVFVLCDVRGLDLKLGAFKWVTFDNCEISSSVVAELIKNLTEVTFKECTLADSMKPEK